MAWALGRLLEDRFVGLGRAERVRRARLREGDELSAVLVPELQVDAPHGLPDREHGYLAKDLVLVVGALEVVVRNPRVEVVDVVQADVPAEELENLRQLQVRTALKCGLGVAPVIGALPVRVLELVLDVEQPDSGRAGEHRRRQPHEQQAVESDEPPQSGADDEQSEVGAEHAVAHPGPLGPRGDPGSDHHREDRADAEHHERVAHHAVSETASP